MAGSTIPDVRGGSAKPRESLVRPGRVKSPRATGNATGPSEDAQCLRSNRADASERVHGPGDRSGAVGAARGGVTGVGRLGEGRDRTRACDYPGHDDGARDSRNKPLKVSGHWHDAALQAKANADSVAHYAPRDEMVRSSNRRLALGSPRVSKARTTAGRRDARAAGEQVCSARVPVGGQRGAAAARTSSAAKGGSAGSGPPGRRG